MPAAVATNPGTEAQTQLALFRAMRQSRKRSVELSSQLVLAKQEAARQSAQHEDWRQTLMLAGEAAAAQAQTVERLQAALHLAQQQLAESEAVRLSTEAKAQAASAAALEALDGRDAAVRRIDSLSAQLASLRSSLNEARATSACELLHAQQQAAMAQEQIISLGIRLRDSEVALQVKSDELQECVTARDHALKVAIGATEALLATKRKLAELEAQLAKKTAFIEEFHPKLKHLYARLLLIKEKQDWRL